MKSTRRILIPIVMVPIAALMAVPFYYILINTFKSQEETANAPLALPQHWDFSNYVNVFQNTPVVQSFLNTVYVTAISIVLMLAIGSLAAFGKIIGKGWFSTAVGAVLIAAFIIPGQATLIPLYRMLVGVHLVDSLNGLIVIYSCGSIFCYYLILGYMRTVPADILEAARLDGAGPLRVYWTIVLPLIRPILVTVGVFQTMWVWNDFITPNVFISSADKQTLVLQVYSAVGEFTTDWPAFMTLTVIVLIPMVIFFIAMQRQIVSGLVQGSIKG
ncbi:MAG: carbohydrate ABC transporter permease [Actinomycetales bacterium]